MKKLAIVGAGHWGPNLVRNFHGHHRSAVAWVVDRAEDRLARIRQAFPDVPVTTDAARAIDDPAVDAVVVATPTSTHHEIARAALLAGKHVLVEKPMASTVAQAEELRAVAEHVDRVLMVGHVFIYNAAIQRVRQYLQDQELGRIYYVSMVRTNLGPIRNDVNAAWDLAAHDVSILNYWLDAAPLSVSAVGGCWINGGIEDAVFATLRYPNDVLANLHVSWLNPRKIRDITLVGDKKMLTFDDMNLSEPLRIYDKRVTDDLTRPGYADSFASFRASIRDGDVLIPRVSTGEPLRSECEHFLECLERGRAPLTGASEGLAVVRALEALTRSVRNAGHEEPV